MSEIDWTQPISADFTDADDWSTGVVPGASDSAILGALSGVAYTVTISSSQTVSDIETSANATLDLSEGVFTVANGDGSGANAGTIDVADQATLQADRTLNNTGVLDLLGTSKGANLTVGASGMILTGGGEVILADALAAPFQPCPPKYALDHIEGAAGAVLTNVNNTIAGAGWLGMGELQIVNKAKGVIDASLATPMMLTSDGPLINTGLLEATGQGGLYINFGVVDNAGGVINANGGIVYTEDGTDIVAGLLTSSGAGKIYLDYGPATFDGATDGALTNNAYVWASPGSTLTLDGAIKNTGKIVLATGLSAHSPVTDPGFATLYIGTGGVTLSGGGLIALGGSSPNVQITGDSAAAVLTNVNNTIEGGGKIGAGALTLVNEARGVIASINQDTLTLNPGVNTIVNAGLIEAENRSSLTIEGVVNNTGTIAAVSDGSLTLNGATITGGAVTVAQYATLILDGVVTISGTRTIANAGALDVSGGDAVISGKVRNTGVISILGGDLDLTGAVSGNGQIDIGAGTADFGLTFNENVTFTGTAGVLGLAGSRSYAGVITGLSTDGTNALDLGDIAFGAHTTVSYAGTTASGVLTVTNGARSAEINLSGDYAVSQFTLTSDGHGGTSVTASANQTAAAPSVLSFAGRMASVAAGGAGSAGAASESSQTSAITLAAPAA